ISMPLQVLPTRTLRVKVCVCSLIGPDSTSNASICVRAGGARSAIGAVFRLLLVGQPFGPGADVAAIVTAAKTASVSAQAAVTATGLAIRAGRNRGCQGSRSMVPPQLTRPLSQTRGSLTNHARDALSRTHGDQAHRMIPFGR